MLRCMKENLSEIVFILDRSGSMESMRAEAIGGFNKFIESQQAEPDPANVSLVLFDDEYSTVFSSIPIQRVRKIGNDDFVPRACTALLDAVGRAIDELGQRLSNMNEEDRPGHVVVVILTDGLENASRRYSQSQVADMVRHQRETYSWEFIFLGADLAALEHARSLNIDPASTAQFQASKEGMLNSYMCTSDMVSETRARKRRRVQFN